MKKLLTKVFNCKCVLHFFFFTGKKKKKKINVMGVDGCGFVLFYHLGFYVNISGKLSPN